MNLEPRNVQPLSVMAKASFGDALINSAQSSLNTNEKKHVVFLKPTYKTNQKLSTQSTDMSFSVEPSSSDFTVTVTNQSTGELIRKLNFKSLNAEVFKLSKLTGFLVDIKG